MSILILMHIINLMILSSISLYHPSIYIYYALSTSISTSLSISISTSISTSISISISITILISHLISPILIISPYSSILPSPPIPTPPTITLSHSSILSNSHSILSLTLYSILNSLYFYSFIITLSISIDFSSPITSSYIFYY